MNNDYLSSKKKKVCFFSRYCSEGFRTRMYAHTCLASAGSKGGSCSERLPQVPACCQGRRTLTGFSVTEAEGRVVVLLHQKQVVTHLEGEVDWPMVGAEAHGARLL